MSSYVSFCLIRNQTIEEIKLHLHTEHSHCTALHIRGSLMSLFYKVKLYNKYKVLRGDQRQRDHEGLVHNYIIRTNFSLFPFDGVKCQDRLLIPDWIWLQSADAAASDTPEKACSSALNALVLTVESQAGGHALGHGDPGLAPELWPPHASSRAGGKVKAYKQKWKRSYSRWQLATASTLSA